MGLVSLVCRRCGGALQVRPDVEQLACGHCGTPMRVDRTGHAISLHFIEIEIEIEPLGDVRTETAQTAAELALARLDSDAHACRWEIRRLEAEHFAARFNKDDLLSGADLRTVVAAQADAKRAVSGFPVAGAVYFAALMIGIAWAWAWAAHRGFMPVLGAAVGVSIAVSLAGIVIGATIHRSSPETRLDQINDRLRRHAEADRCVRELGRIEQLKSELGRIELEMARSREGNPPE